MIASAHPVDLEECAWLIGEDEPPQGLGIRARKLRETRIAAAIFKRRAHLLFTWRQQSLRRCTAIDISRRRRVIAHEEVTVVSDLPRHLPPLREEIATWRSFLGDQIHAILFGND